MQVAQSLYESGLITYMRTDGIGISAEIINEIRGLISDRVWRRLSSRKSKNI